MRKKKQPTPQPPKGGAKGKSSKERKAKSTRKEHPDRKLAGILYSINGMSQKEIAGELDLNEKTVGKWKDEDGWDALRQVQNLSPITLIKNAYEQSEAIYAFAKKEGRLINSKEADTLNKMASTVEKLSNRLDASTLMAAIMELGNFTRPIDHAFTLTLARYGKEFVRTKLQKG